MPKKNNGSAKSGLTSGFQPVHRSSLAESLLPNDSLGGGVGAPADSAHGRVKVVTASSVAQPKSNRSARSATLVALAPVAQRNDHSNGHSARSGQSKDVEMRDMSGSQKDSTVAAAAPVRQQGDIRKLNITAGRAAAQNVISIHEQKPFADRAAETMKQGWLEFLLTGLSSIFMLILYFKSNEEGKGAMLPLFGQFAAGIAGTIVNTFFTGPQLLASAEAMGRLVRAARTDGFVAGVVPTVREKIVLATVPPIVLSALAASLSYIPSVKTGETVDPWGNGQPDDWVYRVALGGAILNAILVIRPSINGVSWLMDRFFMPKNAWEKRSAVGVLQADIQRALVGHNPVLVDDLLERVSRISLGTRDALEISALALANLAESSQVSWSDKFLRALNMLPQASFYVAAVVLYFATIPNLKDAVMDAVVPEFLRDLFVGLLANTFTGAAFWNATNFGFAAYYAPKGATEVSLIVRRVYNNYDLTPVVSTLAAIASIGIVSGSCFTALSQALTAEGGGDDSSASGSSASSSVDTPEGAFPFAFLNSPVAGKMMALTSAYAALWINFTALEPFYTLLHAGFSLFGKAFQPVADRLMLALGCCAAERQARALVPHVSFTRLQHPVRRDPRQDLSADLRVLHEIKGLIESPTTEAYNAKLQTPIFQALLSRGEAGAGSVSDEENPRSVVTNRVDMLAAARGNGDRRDDKAEKDSDASSRGRKSLGAAVQ
jgi:hypothetical protein